MKFLLDHGVLSVDTTLYKSRYNEIQYNDIFSITIFQSQQRICHAFISQYWEIWKKFEKRERKLQSAEAENYLTLKVFLSLLLLQLIHVRCI
jgi:hypothetical protein